MKNLIRKIIPPFLISWYHFFLAFLGTVVYGFPSRKLKVIGITGTNGKSTVVDLATRILEEAGFKTASISSIKFKIRDKEWPNTLKMTMPGRLKLQKFLRQALNTGCQYAVLEVTSEGIKQHRHRFIDFDVAVFTNLTPEHIEAHGSFEKYREAKSELFKNTKKVHIVNLNDENAEYFLNFQAERKVGYTVKSPNVQTPMSNQTLSPDDQILKVEDYQLLANGSNFFIDNVEFNLRLLGKFNISNSLAAICVGLSQDIDLKIIKKALEKVEGIPGRMEIVIREPFSVIVDYAHTPDSLRKVYGTIKKQRLICVLGAAGGGRDKWKRPELGKIAAEYCDQIILTNEDPYSENPNQIIEEISSGALEEIRVNPRSYLPAIGLSRKRWQAGPRKSASIHKILDRREAISRALKIAEPNDVVIITGKGCEPWMCVARGKKIPWDDRQVVREEFARLNSPSG